MIPFSLSDIAKILKARKIGKDLTIFSISTDSRKMNLKHNNFSLFIALKGKRFDAHNFAKDAIMLGAVALLVDHKLNFTVSQLIVSDTKIAMLKLAAWMRKRVSIKTIGITGSSGKTTVKEMTSVILKKYGNVLSTYGNFNNEIGVSLTLLKLKKEHKFGVFELGANHYGEISLMSSLIKPKSVLINNISYSHLKGFNSIKGISLAKSEIFANMSKNGFAIINSDSNDLTNWKKIIRKDITIWNFSLLYSRNVDFFANRIKIYKDFTIFNLHSPFGNRKIKLFTLGKHNISNALASIALSMSFGAKLSTVVNELKHFKPLNGRLFPIKLSNKCLLLDDSYNSNIGSMLAAIKTLKNIPGYNVMVVNDMLELGTESIKYHEQIGKIIALTKEIDRVLSIGNFSYFITKNNNLGEHYTCKDTLIDRLINLISINKKINILVKGSRSTSMEEIVFALIKEYNVNFT